MLLLPPNNARLGRRVLQRIAYAAVAVLMLLLKPVLFAESWGTPAPQTSDASRRRRLGMIVMPPLRGVRDDENMFATATEKAINNRLLSRRRALLDTALTSLSSTFVPTAASAASSETASATPMETSSTIADTSTTPISPSNGYVPSRSSSIQSPSRSPPLPTINMLPSNSIAVRLAQGDPSLLSNRIFNAAPPPRQVYPAWLHGEWHIASSFAGFVLVSRKISKQRIVQNVNVPGFTKCSIAATADIGKEQVAYNWRVTENGVEDRRYNFQQSINAYLGYPAVRDVIYDGANKLGGNPNRIGIDFVNYRTTNAERIELFANARESCEYRIDNQDDTRSDSKDGAMSSSKRVFCCAEYLRQVTFGTGSTVGVPRQAVTNYAHYWTYTNNGNTDGNGDSGDNTDSDSINSWTGNLLTAAYLDPNDAMYFDEPTLPVVMYSHRLVATRV